VITVLALAAMPLTSSVAIWLRLRFVAGIASAVTFVAAVGSALYHLWGHLPGWAFGGIGGGIALSGLLSGLGDWRAVWWVAAGLAAVISVPAWNLDGAGKSTVDSCGRVTRPFAALFVSYGLEGVGYIIAGTFLVAALSPGWVGSAAWVIVGLAAVPSAALWAWLSARWSHPTLLAGALLLQASGIALPALAPGPVAAVVGAVLFGGTFIGVSTMALAAGRLLGFPGAVALLTSGYSVGQILGPVAVTPLLRHGFSHALLAGALVVLLSAIVAGVLRFGFTSAGVDPRQAATSLRRRPALEPRG